MKTTKTKRPKKRNTHINLPQKRNLEKRKKKFSLRCWQLRKQNVSIPMGDEMKGKVFIVSRSWWNGAYGRPNSNCIEKQEQRDGKG